MTTGRPPTPTRVLFDAGVFLYARGRDHPYRRPCVTLVRAARDRHIAAEVGVEALQEVAHVLLRRGAAAGMRRDDVAGQVRDLAEGWAVHPFERDDLDLALRYAAAVDRLDMRDAVHAATAVRRGIGVIVSADRAFDALSERTGAPLRRLDPVDAVAELLPAADDGSADR